MFEYCKRCIWYVSATLANNEETIEVEECENGYYDGLSHDPEIGCVEFMAEAEPDKLFPDKHCFDCHHSYSENGAVICSVKKVQVGVTDDDDDYILFAPKDDCEQYDEMFPF